MLNQISHITYALPLVLAIIMQPVALHAEESVNQSSPIFIFQQKLAMKGNARAQYKLASLYETGKGVELNIEQAKHWYDEASKGGLKSAADRYTYLTVKEQGYDKAVHSAWLEGVKTDANDHKADAMFLLGQLYREGLGVKKDLNRSLEIQEQVRLLGDADVEGEIALIHAEKAENKEKQAALNKQKAEAVRLAMVEKKQQAKVQVKVESELGTQANKEQESQLQAQDKADELAQAEKIRRYEKAMMKLKQEQRLIDEQQAWAGSGKAGDADDEI